MTYQDRVRDWMFRCFDESVVNDPVERAYRFLEESLELVQSLGLTRAEAIVLVDYVFGRPVGQPVQECGGVMVTLAALCGTVGMQMDREAEAELTRISSDEVIARIRAKQATKPKGTPLPGSGS